MEDYIVSGSTKSGIAYTVDTRVRKDSRFLHLLVKMQDKKRAELERTEALFSLLDMLFGGDEGVFAFENEVAVHHDGLCTQENLIAELKDIFEALNLKNSSPSQSS